MNLFFVLVDLRMNRLEVNSPVTVMTVIFIESFLVHFFIIILSLCFLYNPCL